MSRWCFGAGIPSFLKKYLHPLHKGYIIEIYTRETRRGDAMSNKRSTTHGYSYIQIGVYSTLFILNLPIVYLGFRNGNDLYYRFFLVGQNINTKSLVVLLKSIPIKMGLVVFIVNSIIMVLVFCLLDSIVKKTVADKQLFFASLPLRLRSGQDAIIFVLMWFGIRFLLKSIPFTSFISSALLVVVVSIFQAAFFNAFLGISALLGIVGIFANTGTGTTYPPARGVNVDVCKEDVVSKKTAMEAVTDTMDIFDTGSESERPPKKNQEESATSGGGGFPTPPPPPVSSHTNSPPPG